jgi:hypothetical protein
MGNTITEIEAYAQAFRKLSRPAFRRSARRSRAALQFRGAARAGPGGHVCGCCGRSTCYVCHAARCRASGKRLTAFKRPCQVRAPGAVLRSRRTAHNSLRRKMIDAVTW